MNKLVFALVVTVFICSLPGKSLEGAHHSPRPGRLFYTNAPAMFRRNSLEASVRPFNLACARTCGTLATVGFAVFLVF